MVYLVGVLGFIGGFVFGMMVLHFLLRHRSREDLITDSSLKWKYGLLCWGCAGLGVYAFTSMYQLYFG